MNAVEKLIQEESLEQKQRIEKRFHKPLPKLHALSNREMSDLEGGRLSSARNEKLGSFSFGLSCP